MSRTLVRAATRSTHRTFCAEALGVLLVVLGCSGPSGSSSTPPEPTAAPAADGASTRADARIEVPSEVSGPAAKPTVSPEPEAKPMSDSNVMVCSKWSECVKHDGKRVQLEGVYTVQRPLAGMKGGEDIVRVRIIPEGGRRGAYLEPYWHADHVRSEDERAAFEGQSVRVIGTLYVTPPPPPGHAEAATMGGACIHPVESITAVP